MSYTLAILGAGPGGYVAAIRAAQLGAKVCVIEKEHLGGTCLNWGCIPTKAILGSLEVLEKIKNAGQYGITVGPASIDLAAVMGRKNEVTAKLRGGIEMIFKKRGIDLVAGTGVIIGPQEIQVTDSTGQKKSIQAEKLIIATGSRPLVPPAFGYNGQLVITSTEALALTTVPRDILVIGGSAVGCEFATIFNALGSTVTMVEMLPQILPLEDADIVKRLVLTLKRKKITMKTGVKIVDLKIVDNRVRAQLENGETLEAEKALVAVGRKLNTEGIGLENIGITPVKGGIPVNEYLQTSVPGVYAIGDVTGKMLLAHLASHQGIIAAENALGKPRAINYAVVPRCTFTMPELASVGLTEEQARQQGGEVTIGKFPFAASGMALAKGETDGFVKLVGDANGKLVGAHILGPHASDLIAEAALAMKLRATLHDIAETIHAHPTLGEAVGEAAEDGEGMGIHTIR
jgi:dihydrolipoamide dehydrogenase